MKFMIVAVIAVCSLCATVSAQCDTAAFTTCSTDIANAVSDAATDNNDIFSSSTCQICMFLEVLAGE